MLTLVDRRYAMASDDEMIMGVPMAHLSRIYENLKEAHQAVLQISSQV